MPGPVRNCDTLGLGQLVGLLPSAHGAVVHPVEVPVERGAGDAGLGGDLGHGEVVDVAEVSCPFQVLLGVRCDLAPGALSLLFPDGSGVRGSLGGVGAFHLGEQAEEHDGQVADGVTGLGGVDGDGVGEGLSNNGTASGDNGLKTAGFVAIRICSLVAAKRAMGWLSQRVSGLPAASLLPNDYELVNQRIVGSLSALRSFFPAFPLPARPRACQGVG